MKKVFWMTTPALLLFSMFEATRLVFWLGNQSSDITLLLAMITASLSALGTVSAIKLICKKLKEIL